MRGSEMGRKDDADSGGTNRYCWKIVLGRHLLY